MKNELTLPEAQSMSEPALTIRPQKVVGKIEGHKVNPINDLVEIVIADEPGAGGANHVYLVYWPVTTGSAAWTNQLMIQFQNGPITENGVNGVTQEVLLAIVQHRLRCFQAGPYACTENGEALRYVAAALECLKARTKARMARGVEGTNQK